MNGQYHFTGALILGLILIIPLPAAPGGNGLGLSPHFLWTGSVETEKNLVTREDLRLSAGSLPGFSLRFQLTDRRPARLESFQPENLNLGITAFGGGLYHKGTGSRLLHGVLDEWGLPARVRNPWIRSVPFTEYHKPQAADLKTEPSTTKEPGTYLYLGSPRLGPFGAFASVLLEEDLVPAFGGGFDLQLKKKTELRLEGFYTGRELPPRGSSAWFSEKPPLRERDFRLYALGFLFNSPLAGISADWAYSETFAYGRDLYGNLGIRLGEKPWQLALAVDGAGDRYVGRDGSVTGSGFRTATRLDRRGPRSSLFRLSTSLRASAFGEAFERSSSQIYYRFPTVPRKAENSFRPSRVSLTLSRNASNKKKIEDTLEGTLGLKWGAWTGVLQGNIHGMSVWEDPGPVPAFPLPDSSTEFYSARLSGELGYSPGKLSFSTKVGYAMKKDKEAVWDTSFYASIRGKAGRLSLKAASPDFPSRWSGTVSWRLELP